MFFAKALLVERKQTLPYSLYKASLLFYTEFARERKPQGELSVPFNLLSVAPPKGEKATCAL